MKKEMTVQETGTASEVKLDKRAQLAQHLAQQSQSRRTFDRFMKVLELAGLVLIAGYLAWAIYVSINWSEPQKTVAVWFAFPICVFALGILISVHAVGVRAFFPIIVPNSSFPFVTGSEAVPMGLGFAAVLLLVGVFWGAFVWGIWANDWALLEPLVYIVAIVAAVVGVGAIFAIFSDLYKRFIRSR
jgi:hypothetical protein